MRCHRGGVVAIDHAVCIRIVGHLRALRHQRHREADAWRQLHQAGSDRRAADDHHLGARQQRVDEELQRAARVARHAELEHVAEVAFVAFFGGRDADHASAAVLQGLPHGSYDGRLRTAAADPAVHLAIGSDDGFVPHVR